MSSDKKGLNAFLGITGYYRRFVPKYAGRAGSLYAALRPMSCRGLSIC